MQVWEWAGMIGSILVLDLALSGDNALVLGAAAAGLPHRQRWYALFLGGAGAIVLRILFASIATIILNVPFLQTAGAFILIIIAVKLLAERTPVQEKHAGEEEKESDEGQANLKAAALTILVADVTMSLDNVLAIGAAANGDILPIIFGLLISIAIIIGGSAIIAELMHRLTWLLDLAAIVLAWTSATMMRDDLAPLAAHSQIPWLVTISQSGLPFLPFHLSWFTLLLAALTFAIVISFDFYYRWRARQG